MKRLKLAFLAFAGILFGCQQAELVDPNEMGNQNMKTVTISADMNVNETKASIDSESGAVTWQSGDVISVLATDGKFYDFILKEGIGAEIAEFAGNIPETANVTTVATYPRILASGSENTILTGNTLTYVLPTEWNYAPEVSNVPMVATFGEGADHMSFKQVGGVMRFPVKNLPKEAKFVVTMNDKTITGQFPVDITALGEAVMTAGSAASVLTINYSSEVDGGSAEFNVPVPAGVYNNFNVTVKDAEGNALFSKDYSAENKVNRRTLLNMKELTLPERPMVISEVWPFYVDARVIFSKNEGVTKYAFYVDGAEEPVIVEAEDWDDMAGALVGGTFGHNTTHTVAVAKVVDDKPVAESKSAAVSFTTADIRQLTTNTGSKFVSVGWDDVAIGYGPKYENGKWSAVLDPIDLDEKGRKLHQRRGYQVQLLDENNNVIYDLIPFAGHMIFQTAFYDSSSLGKINDDNIITPTAISFGFLQPGKDYYFRVKALDGVVIMDENNGNYNPDDNGSKPYPYPLSSQRGGCSWSELVKLSTDPVHVPSENEILHESFEDIMINVDYMNWAVSVVPDLAPSGRLSKADYLANAPKNYPAFFDLPENERKWTTSDWNTAFKATDIGLFDEPYTSGAENKLNAYAGNIQGWTVNDATVSGHLHPFVGAVGLGKAWANHGGAHLTTPSINSELLLSNKGTRCTVTLNVGYACQAKGEVANTVYIQIIRDGKAIGSEYGLSIPHYYPDEWAAEFTAYHKNDGGSNNASLNYVHHQRYYELSYDLYLKKGDAVKIFKKTSRPQYGFLLIGDVTIEAHPGEYEQNATFVDNGVGTEPDDTNYDVYGLGEFPVSYFYGPPTSWYTRTNANGQAYYDYDATKQTYQDIKDAGFNIAIYNGENDYSVQENVRLMNICEELGIKFMGQVGGYATHSERIAAIKANLGSSDTYVGEYLADEPNAQMFGNLAQFTEEFMREMPNKEVYVNLFPMYAKVNQTGSVSYDQHVIEFMGKVPTKSVSFDYYGLKTSNELKLQYYQNLDVVRELTLEEKKPFWVITQAGPIGTDTIDPTENEQRWTVWSNIAMGSKGISYFTYWTPVPEAGLGDSEYMLRRDGTKRDMYYYVQKINNDLKTIGKKLLYCHADGAIMSSVSLPLYQNDGNGRTKYGPILGVTAPDPSKSFFVGCFRDARKSMNGDNYKGYKAMVVSKFHNRDITADLNIAETITEVTFTHNNTSDTITLTSGLNTNVGMIGVSFINGVLSLDVPSGEAVLLEF